jgi:hypothetical protein
VTWRRRLPRWSAWPIAFGLLLLVHSLAKRHLAGLDPIAAMIRGRAALEVALTVLVLLAARLALFVFGPIALGAVVGRAIVLRSAPDAAKEQPAPAENARSGE